MSNKSVEQESYFEKICETIRKLNPPYKFNHHGMGHNYKRFYTNLQDYLSSGNYNLLVATPLGHEMFIKLLDLYIFDFDMCYLTYLMDPINKPMGYLLLRIDSVWNVDHPKITMNLTVNGEPIPTGEHIIKNYMSQIELIDNDVPCMFHMCVNKSIVTRYPITQEMTFGHIMARMVHWMYVNTTSTAKWSFQKLRFKTNNGTWCLTMSIITTPDANNN